MRVQVHDGQLVAVPDDAVEREEIAAWKSVHAGHVFLLRVDDGSGLAFTDLGPGEVACREPINVVSTHPDLQIRLLSNFAATPLVLDGQLYQSVEGFWQGLKFPDEADRRRLAKLSGIEAKRAGEKQRAGDAFEYGGQEIRVGTRGHWDLMEQANWAKFTQVAEARQALLATAPRPLVHRVRKDSRTIPGVIMADIWLRIRDRLTSAAQG